MTISTALRQLSIFVFTISLISIAHSQSVDIQTLDYQQALAKAKSENKMLLIFACQDWLETCGIISEEVFYDAGVAKEVNGNFVTIAVDPEKFPNSRIDGRILVKSIPEFLFVDSNGKLQYRESGYMGPGELISVCQLALDSKNHYDRWVEKYDAGERDPEWMTKYIQIVDGRGDDASKIGKAFLAKVSTDDLIESSNWEIMHAVVDDMDSREFMHFLKNYEKFGQKYSMLMADDLLIRVFTKELTAAIENKDRDHLVRIQKKYDIFLPASEAALYKLKDELTFYSNIEDWNSYKNVAVKLMTNHKPTEAAAINEMAWNFYKHLDDKDALSKALEWSKEALKIDSIYYIHDTYAALLYATGEYESAHKEAKRALKKMHQAGVDTQETEELIAKIEEALKPED